MNLSRPIGRALLVLLVGIAALAGYFLVTSPVTFQKAAVVTAAERAALAAAPPTRWFDIRKLIGAIPYQRGEMVHEVHPGQKYRETIERGRGNCANFTAGLGYHLSRQAYTYQIVHLLPLNTFLTGEGHSVLSLPFVLDGERHRAIVDVVSAGVVMDDRGFVTLESLRQGHLPNPRLLPLHPKADGTTPYFGPFLDRSVVGVVHDHEAARYFRFMEAVYIPLGSRKLEKIAYDGLAVTLGVYPRIYVDAAGYEALFEHHGATWLLARCLLAAIRLFLLLVVAWLAARVWSAARRATGLTC